MCGPITASCTSSELPGGGGGMAASSWAGVIPAKCPCAYQCCGEGTVQGEPLNGSLSHTPTQLLGGAAGSVYMFESSAKLHPAQC